MKARHYWLLPAVVLILMSANQAVAEVGVVQAPLPEFETFASVLVKFMQSPIFKTMGIMSVVGGLALGLVRHSIVPAVAGFTHALVLVFMPNIIGSMLGMPSTSLPAKLQPSGDDGGTDYFYLILLFVLCGAIAIAVKAHHSQRVREAQALDSVERGHQETFGDIRDALATGRAPPAQESRSMPPDKPTETAAPQAHYEETKTTRNKRRVAL